MTLMSDGSALCTVSSMLTSAPGLSGAWMSHRFRSHLVSDSLLDGTEGTPDNRVTERYSGNGGRLGGFPTTNSKPDAVALAHRWLRTIALMVMSFPVRVAVAGVSCSAPNSKKSDLSVTADDRIGDAGPFGVVGDGFVVALCLASAIVTVRYQVVGQHADGKRDPNRGNQQPCSSERPTSLHASSSASTAEVMSSQPKLGG